MSNIKIRLSILKKEYPIHQIENDFYFIGYFIDNTVMIYSLNKWDDTNCHFIGSAKITKNNYIRFHGNVININFDWKNENNL